jgi:Undecaprenyl-phosphate glucose phosphotransferase
MFSGKMNKRLPLMLSAASLAGDLVLITLLFWHFCLFGSFEDIDTYSIYALIAMNLLWLILVPAFGLQVLPRVKQRKKIARDVLLASVILLFLFMFSNFLFSEEDLFTSNIILFLIFTPLSLLLWKLLLDTLGHLLRKHGYNRVNVLIVGYNKKAEELKEYFEANLWSGYRFKGFVCDTPEPVDGCAGSFTDLPALVEGLGINELFLNLSVLPEQYRSEIVALAYEKQLGIKLLPDFGGFPAHYHGYQRFDITPVIAVSRDIYTGSLQSLLKRAFDIILSIIVILLFLSWLSLFFALLISLSSRGPVFFRQKRTGLHTRPFTCLKFRTMVVNEEADQLQASRYDSRITWIGRFLRRISLDELPQFLNVLAGQMSVVGPRPHMLHHTQQYSSLIPLYLHRHNFRPGITGLAQIRGYRGETTDLDQMKSRIEYDIYYIENWSLWLDIKIIFITFVQLFGRKNDVF